MSTNDINMVNGTIGHTLINGYTCALCGGWVTWGMSHICQNIITIPNRTVTTGTVTIMQTKPCDACKNGVFETSDHKPHKCPKCDGTGELPSDLGKSRPGWGNDDMFKAIGVGGPTVNQSIGKAMDATGAVWVVDFEKMPKY